MMGPSVSAGPMPPGQPAGMANKPLFPSAAAIVIIVYHTFYLINLFIFYLIYVN